MCVKQIEKPIWEGCYFKKNGGSGGKKIVSDFSDIYI